MKVLCIGEEWRGSNASGLFYAFSRAGHSIHIINELNFVSVKARTPIAKGFNKVIRSIQINDFNVQLNQVVNSFRPELIFIYKGAFIKPESIVKWKNHSIPVVNFFPDVSFTAHGALIPKCVPLYDYIFTTKSFGKSDLEKNFKVGEKVSFIPHGFDPLIHRPIQNGDSTFSCAASFIGNYSDHKRRYLEALISQFPQIDLRIWGSTWRKEGILSSAVQALAVEGDQYALALNNSKINIALLSEKVTGATRGDQITSRTFHIPASGGFMLHQRTDELLEYFTENVEVVCFSSPDEMIDKIRFFLKNDLEREKVRRAGYERAVNGHSLDVRADTIIKRLKEHKLI